MMRRICLSTVALAMLAAPAFAAEDRCQAPVAPVVPKDGKAATQQDMLQANKDVVAFIKDSDQYQLCLKAAIDDTEKQIKGIDPKHDEGGAIRKQLLALQKDLTNKGDQNQKEKVRLGQAYNAAATSYKSAHK